MNDKRRNKLKSVEVLIDRAISLAQTVLDEEQDCLDNMPENLQGSNRYEKIEEATERLEDAIQCLEDAKDNLDEAMR